MISVGCLSTPFRVCVCHTSNYSVGEAQACCSREKCVSGHGISRLRYENSIARSTPSLILNTSGWENAGNLSRGSTIVHASRRESTLDAEATDRKANERSVEGPSVESHLDLLERFTSERSLNSGGKTIAEQLESQVDADKGEEIALPLAQNVTLEDAPLTIHQKRNIRRQKYLDQVSKRNDAPFFTAVALIVILPPSVILGIAVATGYVQLFP